MTYLDIALMLVTALSMFFFFLVFMTFMDEMISTFRELVMGQPPVPERIKTWKGSKK